MIEMIAAVLLITLSFVGGLMLDSYYQAKINREVKDALEKQYVRLRAMTDADDPCRPYGSHATVKPIPISYQPIQSAKTGPINEAFMNELRTKGRARTAFRKSDLK